MGIIRKSPYNEYVNKSLNLNISPEKFEGIFTMK